MKGISTFFDAMEIETFRDDVKLIEEQRDVSFVLCGQKITYFFDVRNRGVDVVLPSLMMVD